MAIDLFYNGIAVLNCFVFGGIYFHFKSVEILSTCALRCYVECPMDVYLLETISSSAKFLKTLKTVVNVVYIDLVHC